MRDDAISNDSRGTTRRIEDVNAASDIRLLKHELETLKQRVRDDEITLGKRVASLEADNIELARKLSTGKGVLYGVLFSLGGLGLVVVDRLKDFLGVIK